MGMLDMFDKLDDIVYEPIKAICDWTKEPLKRYEHQRDMEKQAQNIAAAERKEIAQRKHEVNMVEQAANIEAKQKILDQTLDEQKRASITADYEARAKIDADIRRWNTEIDNMQNDANFARCERAMNAIINYKNAMSTAVLEIHENIQHMSLEIRNKAQNLVLEHTNRYIEIKERAKDNCMKRLDEIEERYASNERLRTRMEDAVLNDMDSVINAGTKFIEELNEDIKRLNVNADKFINDTTNDAMKFIEDNTSWMLNNQLANSNPNLIEKK